MFFIVKIINKKNNFYSGFSVVPIPLQSTLIQMKDESAILEEGISEKLISTNLNLPGGSISNF
jgi:hypothetical protein